MGIEVRPATGRWDDFASFMVPRKPGGSGCVCIAYRLLTAGIIGAQRGSLGGVHFTLCDRSYSMAECTLPPKRSVLAVGLLLPIAMQIRSFWCATLLRSTRPLLPI